MMSINSHIQTRDSELLIKIKKAIVGNHGVFALSLMKWQYYKKYNTIQKICQSRYIDLSFFFVRKFHEYSYTVANMKNICFMETVN